MINEDKALLGFGTCGVVAVVSITTKEVIGEFNLGDPCFTNDIIRLRQQGKH